MKNFLSFLLYTLAHILSANGQTDSLIISESQAIEIAKKENFYKCDNGWTCKVYISTVDSSWVISSRSQTRNYFFSSYEYNEVKNISIDAVTGKIIDMETYKHTRKL